MVGLLGHGFTEGGLSLVPLQVTSASDSKDRVYTQTHGESNSSLNKVILLFGDDIICKTSLKDALVNYIYQIQIKDTHRLALMDGSALEKDPRIRAYVFNRTEETALPFNIVLIDIPPLGGLHSAEADVRTLLNLERFLQEEFKTTVVNAVNLVAPSSSVFLRPFINTYNLLNLSFEKLESLAQILVTNSPTHMPFISSLRKVKVTYNNLFTFYTENQKSDDDEQFLSQIYLHYDYPGVDDFFQELKSVPPSCMSLVKRIDAGLVVPSDIGRLRVVNQFSETRGRRFGLGFRQLCMKASFKDETDRLQVLSLGKTKVRPNRVVLLVGDRMSGKTTIATAIVNHLFGVKVHDSFRLLIDDELINRFGKTEAPKESTYTTAYILNHIPGSRSDHNLIIIDSVGFGSTEERQYNKTVVLRLTKLVKQICKTEHKISILFAAPGMQNALPESFKIIHKPLLNLIENNMDKMLFLDAYAPNQKSPVPKALKKLESTQIKVFKFDSREPSVGEEGAAKFRTKSKDTIIDMNWLIEHYTLEKIFSQL